MGPEKVKYYLLRTESPVKGEGMKQGELHNTKISENVRVQSFWKSETSEFWCPASISFAFTTPRFRQHRSHATPTFPIRSPCIPHRRAHRASLGLSHSLKQSSHSSSPLRCLPRHHCALFVFPVPSSIPSILSRIPAHRALHRSYLVPGSWFTYSPHVLPP